MTDKTAGVGPVERRVRAHSRGPWRLQKHTGGDSLLDGADDWTIYDADGNALCMEGGWLPPDVARANVALLLAAPALFVAAENWCAYLDGPGDGVDDAELEDRLMQDLRDAVALAVRSNV